MAGLTINGVTTTLSGNQSYDFITITNNGILQVTVPPASTTGTPLVLNVTGDVNVASGCKILADGCGYAGGIGGSASFTCEGGNPGITNGIQAAKGANGIWSYSGGGGGGGGSYGSAGGSGGKGGDWAGGAYIGGSGGSPGATFGTSNGTDIDMGAGAGGGGREGGAFGSTGGNGGGSLTINANNIYIHGIVSANGNTGGTGGDGNGGGGGGGGASGGGILLSSNNILNLSGATITANGGTGGAAGAPGYSSPGGTGGGGRIKLFYGTTYTAPTTLSAGTTYVQLLMGNASFSSNPTNAQIWIDGSSTGITTPNTISNIASGGHSFTLKLTGYIDFSGSFSVSANTTTTVPTATFAGSANISSTPTGARIYLAVSPGTPSDQGITTPSTIINLTAASSGATTVWNYRLTLPSGYADTTGSFTATAGSTVSVPVAFPPSASFTSVPTNARIWIDSVDKGLYTPNTVTGLTAGSRSYTLKLTGYADSSGSFTATAGSTTTVPTVTFAPSAIFATTPSGASIYLDGSGTSSGTTPATITGLTAGSHSYKLFLAGYNAVTGNFSTVAGTTTTIPTILLSGTAMAFLSAGD